MKNKIMSFLRDEEGLTTVEYAVAGGMIALAVILAFAFLSGSAFTEEASKSGMEYTIPEELKPMSTWRNGLEN